MKKLFGLAVGLVLLLIAIPTELLEAQVYTEFDTVWVRQSTSYTKLQQYTTHTANQFALPPNFIPENRDDGYKKVPLPWPYEFNGQVYTSIWINVNGFICFYQDGRFPPNVAPDNNRGLFIQSNSYPNNVAAPYWGDHYYRAYGDLFEGYIPSKIKTGGYTDALKGEAFVVEWEDLNINDERVKSSVGNFQVILFKSDDPFSFQGDIEFAYGVVGSPLLPDSVGTIVITRNAAVGLKGQSSGIQGDDADFVNGLFFNYRPEVTKQPILARTNTQLTDQWPPSEATDQRIEFGALVRKKVDEWWGDGDADLSKAIGNKHYLMQQNRFVTVNDARMVMHSIATNIPLDSVRRRNAYHADVNHNGRYYYDNFGQRQDIRWRDMNYAENLPEGINDVNRIYFQVTEHDASFMLHYMAARVPSLPWIYDTVVRKGKVGIDEDIANAIIIGTPSKIEEGLYRLPIFINGIVEGPISTKFDVNGTITDVTGYGDLKTMYNGSRFVLAGSGEYDDTKPLCNVYVRTDSDVIELSGIRFNDNPVENINNNLRVIEELVDNNSIMSQNNPNPFSANTTITLNIQQEGFYSLEVYDVLGNVVKSLANGDMKPGVKNVYWNGTDNAGNNLPNGVYVYKLMGDNVTASKKLVLSK